MKHITEEYGMTCNLLELTTEELKTLEPFLQNLGVRVRTMIYHTENGEGVHIIQGENPYKFWITEPHRGFADDDMTRKW